MLVLLQALGVHAAFDPVNGDIEVLDSTTTYVGAWFAAAGIDWDTAGATGYSVQDTVVAVNDLRVDGPFVFFVRDTRTGAILFEGRVLDPS